MANEAATNDYLRRFADSPEETVRAAHDRGAAAGVRVVAPEMGTFLRWLAAIRPARSAVEIGSHGGTSGLWLLGGMAERSTLTSIEPDAVTHEHTRRAFTSAGVADRVRSIPGSPAQVLPRLADGSYDLAVLSEDLASWPDHLVHMERILRPGGVMVALGALCEGKVADPAVTEREVDAVRAFNAAVRDDDHWQTVLMPVAGGLLLATAAGRQGA